MLTIVLISYSFTPFTANLALMGKTTFVGLMVLEVYVDDVLFTSRDEANISTTKAYLQAHFVVPDFNTLCYVLRIKFLTNQVS